METLIISQTYVNLTVFCTMFGRFHIGRCSVINCSSLLWYDTDNAWYDRTKTGGRKQQREIGVSPNNTAQ